MPFVLLVVMLFSSFQVLLAAGGSVRISREEVRKAQQALKAEGFDPGPIDGIIGPLTRSALKKFQTSNRMRVTGKLDRSTREQLADKLVKHAPSAPQNLRVIEVGVE